MMLLSFVWTTKYPREYLEIFEHNSSIVDLNITKSFHYVDWLYKEDLKYESIKTSNYIWQWEQEQKLSLKRGDPIKILKAQENKT